MNLSRFSSSACIAIFACMSAVSNAQVGHVGMSDPAPQEKPVSGSPQEQIAPKHFSDQKTIRIELKVPISETDSRTFLSRLSGIVGAELRMPADLPKKSLTLPAGEWSATEILDWLQTTFMRAHPVQGRWHRTFILKLAAKEPEPSCKLSPVGSISLVRQDLTFSDAARAIAQSVHSEVQVNRPITGRFNLKYNDVTAERALEELAAKVGLVVSNSMVFKLDGTPDRVVLSPEFLADLADLADADEGSLDMLQELELVSVVMQLTGMDPQTTDFVWSSVSPAIWSQLGFSREGLSDFQQLMSDRIANRTLTESLSLKMLSGATDISNIDPITGKLKEDSRGGIGP